MNKIITVLFIVLYCWSSKIFETGNKSAGIMDHTEDTRDLITWILDSNVCLLGKISFFLWSMVLLLNLFYSLNKIILFILAIITITVTLFLNMPLFIRSLPAFAILINLITH